jgi:hypothetical protein
LWSFCAVVLHLALPGGILCHYTTLPDGGRMGASWERHVAGNPI